MNRTAFQLIMVLLLLPFPLSAATETVTLASSVAPLQKRDGFLPWYWDEKKGQILLELSPACLNHEFLYFTGLGSGIGSTEVFADRSSFGGNALSRFRRVGSQVLVTQVNADFRAENGSTQ